MREVVGKYSLTAKGSGKYNVVLWWVLVVLTIGRSESYK